jgi:hypothetical protein
VRGVPVHLVRSKYLVQDLQPVEVIKLMGPGDGDDVEEILAQVIVPVLRKSNYFSFEYKSIRIQADLERHKSLVSASTFARAIPPRV